LYNLLHTTDKLSLKYSYTQRPKEQYSLKVPETMMPLVLSHNSQMLHIFIAFQF